MQYMEGLVCDRVIPAWPKISEAGMQPIEHFLTEETRKALDDPGSLLLPLEKMLKNALKSWVRATDDEWFRIVKEATKRGMMRPVEEADILRDRSGHLITNGAGAVHKDKTINGQVVACQRFISIMCPINAVMERIVGSVLATKPDLVEKSSFKDEVVPRIL